jgi:hypothetical protein
VRSVCGGDLLDDGLWIWLSKEKEWLREDLVRTFLGCYISGCISLGGCCEGYHWGAGNLG